MALLEQTAICRGAHSKGSPGAFKELNPANNYMSLQVDPSINKCPVDPNSDQYVTYSLVKDAESEDPVKLCSNPLTHKNCEIMCCLSP